MERDRVGQILNFAESLKQDTNGEEVLAGAIKNAERLRHEGPVVERTLNVLEQVRKAFRLIPQEAKNN